MEIRVRSRDSTADVRDEFGIHDGFNSFVSDIEDSDGRQSLATTFRSRDSTLVEPQSDGQQAGSSALDTRQWPEKVAPDPNEVTFNGPNDPDDPLNFPTWRKWMIVVTIASASTCV
jgi:hypothetical protein